MDDVWLTTAELAKRLRTNPSTVRYWKHRGYGPQGTRFGRNTLYKLADVIAWEKQQQAAQQETSAKPRSMPAPRTNGGAAA